MQFILPAVYIVVFVLLILKWDFFENPFLNRKMLALLFGLKLVAAASVWLIYTYYYCGSDFFTYFSDSSAFVHNVFNSDPVPYSSAWTGSFDDSFFSSSRFMILLNSALHLFSFGNFYVHSVFFCFFSFIGLTALLKVTAMHYPDKKGVIIAFFLVPSVLFWGSAPLKEAVILGALGLLVYLTGFGLKREYSKTEIFLSAVMLFLLACSKFYILFALLPGFIVNIVVSRTSEKRIFLKYLAVVCSVAGLLWLAGLASSDLNILKRISDRQAKAISEAKGGYFLADDKNFIHVESAVADNTLLLQTDSTFKIKNGSSYLLWQQNNMKDTTFVKNSTDTSSYKLLYSVIPAYSVIPLKKLKPEPLGFILYSPVAFLTTLTHPTLAGISSWLHLAAAIENAWIILLIILSVCFFDKKVLEKKHVLLFFLVFSFILFVLIGISTPVTGAMLRYRTSGLVFFTAACFLVLDTEKLKKRLLRK